MHFSKNDSAFRQKGEFVTRLSLFGVMSWIPGCPSLYFSHICQHNWGHKHNIIPMNQNYLDLKKKVVKKCLGNYTN